MKVSKLRSIHVVIIGSFACIAVILGTYFLVIKKYYVKINELNGRLQTAEQIWQRKAQAEAELEAAKLQNRLMMARYERYMREKMPSLSFEDRTQGMIALWKEHGEVLGPLLEKWPRKTGVIFAGGVQVPAAPTDPNSIDTTLIRIPVGTFSVVGDFRSILAHLRSWNRFNRLVQIDPATLSGTSPRITAQYSVTVYIFPRGEAGPTVTMAGGAGGTGNVMGAPPSTSLPSGPSSP
jgi:hypothetical protein